MKNFYWIKTLLDFFWSGFLWIGTFFIILYFLRSQKVSNLIVTGLLAIFTGLRLFLGSIIVFNGNGTEKIYVLYLSISILTLSLLILSELSLIRVIRAEINIFSILAITSISEILLWILGRPAAKYLISISALVILSLSIFHKIVILRSKRKPKLAKYVILSTFSAFISVFMLISSSNLSFLILSDFFMFLAVLFCLLGEAMNIASYFSEVEDLTYDLKVSNASLKKSESLVKQKNDELHHQANHDFLTNLPNRMSLYHLATATLETNLFQNHKVGFLLLDLDRFKQLNDSMGHQMGDLLLQRFSENIRSILRSSDQLYRLGGDEFTIMVSEIHSEDDLNIIIKKIYRKLEEPIVLGNINYRVSSSMGAAIFPDHGENIDTLLGKADIALYEAKEAGRNRSVIFRQSMQGKTDNYFNLRKRLSEALERNEFSVVFQPQFSFNPDMSIYGLEALVRLSDGENGFISPGLFIPIAEDSGFILPLGRWIFDKVLETSMVWVTENPSLKISVNVSATQFRNDGFLDEVKSLLKKWDFPAENLVIELTENLALNNDKNNIKTINELRKIGIEIAIDDFGKGYSSLKYLKEFPMDHIKIDKSFIQDIPFSRSDKTIVKSVLNMASSLGMRVVAEGVENQDQLNYLTGIGCHVIQGFHLARPISANKIPEILGVYKGLEKEVVYGS